MKKLFFILLSVSFYFSAHAESAKAKRKKKMSDTLEKANYYFDQKAPLLALPIYQYLLDSNPDKKMQTFYKYRLGICCLYKTDEYEKALTLLTEVMEKNKKAADIQFYLGRAYMLNYKFDEATFQFTEHAKKKKSLPELKNEAVRYIENCNNGKELVAKAVNVIIENIGPPVNTTASEYVPVISSDESILIFTYRGEKSTGGLQSLNRNDPGSYLEDVFISEKIDGKWGEPYTAGDSINSIEHDACIALSGDGQKLFVFKNNGVDLGDIYMSKLTGKTWTTPLKLKGDVNSSQWDGSCSLSPNEKILFFSSERSGGAGGRDLYVATLQPDSSWGNIKNLSVLNTTYDDDSPFILPDGNALIFSSKGYNSMGGYDIFISTRQDTTWSPPVNMGYPINTPGDDIYYVISADGTRGYYSSGKAGGYGQQDIYAVGPGLVDRKVTLVQLKGLVTYNDNPTDCDIEVVNLNKNENYGTFKSNSATGKYLINLPAGADYKVIFKKSGLEPKSMIVSAENVDSYFEQTYNVEFFEVMFLSLVDSVTGKVVAKAEQKKRTTFRFITLNMDSAMTFLLEGKDIDSLNEVYIIVKDSLYKLVRCGNKYFCYRPLRSDLASLSKINTSDVPFGAAGNYADLVKAYGDIKADGLIFKVQIGAYNKPENFRYGKLKSLGKVSRKKYSDEITRFTIGSYSTLKAADKMLAKVKAKGFDDAFVTAFYNDQRFLLRDLGSLKK